MASGSFEFAASGYLQGKIDWSSSSNGSSANSSNVTAILYARRTNSYTTYGKSWSGYVKIGSVQTNIGFSSTVYVSSTWIEMARVTTTVNHNNNGTGSVNISGSVTGPTGTALAGNTSSGNQTVTLDMIPRYTSITSFTVSKRNETSFTFNWTTADTIDYVWYSTNNGANWIGYDVTDGTSGSFVASGLSPNAGYNCKIRVRRKDSQLNTDSGTVYQTTYKIPSHSFNNRTLNSITVNWACDSTVDGVWYSLENGSNWVWVNDPRALNGTYTIYGLEPNTRYNIVTIIRRLDSQTTYAVGGLGVTTHDIARITSVPNINFGDTARVVKTNPSNVQNNLRVETLNPTSTFATRNNVGNDYTITFTDEEWDTVYRRLGTNNSITIRFVIDTIGNTTYYDWIDKTLTLRGNQKTAYVGVNGNKRAKVYVGLGGTVKRAVVWIGNNGRKRCI